MLLLVVQFVGSGPTGAGDATPGAGVVVVGGSVGTSTTACQKLYVHSETNSSRY